MYDNLHQQKQICIYFDMFTLMKTQKNTSIPIHMHTSTYKTFAHMHVDIHTQIHVLLHRKIQVQAHTQSDIHRNKLITYLYIGTNKNTCTQKYT